MAYVSTPGSAITRKSRKSTGTTANQRGCGCDGLKLGTRHIAGCVELERACAYVEHHVVKLAPRGLKHADESEAHR